MTKEKEQIGIRYLLKALFAACFAELVFVAGKITLSQFKLEILYVKMFLVFAAIAVACWLLARSTGRRIGDMLFQYRYPLALLLLVVLVALEISGSSIGMWISYLPEGENPGLLWNLARTERSDEWATFTPLAFTSFFNPEGKFSYFNSIARGTLTDSFLVYGQPVLDIAIVFRPFQIGYLFLGMSRGLSFFWCSRLIALFLSSLELGMLLTKKNKSLSALFAVLIAFAPVVHWWFSVNSLVEMLVAGNCFILMINQWIHNRSVIKRSLYALIMGICGGGYILALYPAWMVPLGYVYLALFIWVIYENRKNISVQKMDVIPLFIFLFVCVGGVLHVFLQSKDALNLVLNSAYPGKREALGGGGIHWLFNYVLTLFTAFYTTGFEVAACSEFSAFLSLYPIGYVLAVYTLIRRKKTDMLLILAMLFEIVLDLYAVVEFPAFLAKITLLSWSITNRVAQVSGFFQIILIVRSMTLLGELRKTQEGAADVSLFKKEYIGKAAVCVVSFCCAAAVLWQSKKIQPNYWKTVMILAGAAALFVLFYCVLRSRKQMMQRAAIWLWGLAAVFSSVLVNPVQRGIDVVYENPMIQEVQRIVKEDPDAKWAVDNLGYPMNNSLMMAGASTINSTNVYPNLDFWGQFDPDGAYEDIYNRYAHIVVNLTAEGETEAAGKEKFELIQADLFKVDLDWEDIKKTGVTYVLTNRILEQEMELEETQYCLHSRFGNYFIYQLIYER